MQKLTVCIAALVGLMCGVADCSSARAKTLDAAQVRVVGESRDVARVEQGGSSVPLRHALEQIVPPAYSINLPNAGPWADAPVSWHAHVPFIVALREALATTPDVTADVDLKLRLVTVRASASNDATSDDAAFAMKHVWGLPPHTNTATNTATNTLVPPPVEPVQVPTLNTQPPLLVAMQSAPPAHVAVAPAPTAIANRATSMGATTNPRAVVATTASTTTANTTTTADAIGDSLPAQPSAEPIRQWHLSVSDHTVKTALTRWAKEDGWQLVWDVPIDFGIDADATVTGTFEQALQAVVEALKKSETPIQAILYRGNKVLRIVAKGAA
ncbi:toxin co-regulated pilus biosynthesis Q family protein [Trinickia acidisoli]|uniref:toxin co-regulated pilus biosynthesis Q family protein n=1 Tax=Trinickia acidisoli TaxID=2767482 RepID=UPI0035ABE8D6